MSEFISVRYGDVIWYITKYVDRMAAFHEHPQSIKSPVVDTLSVGLLLASIDVEELSSVFSATKKLREDNITW